MFACIHLPSYFFEFIHTKDDIERRVYIKKVCRNWIFGNGWLTRKIEETLLPTIWDYVKDEDKDEEIQFLYIYLCNLTWDHQNKYIKTNSVFGSSLWRKKNIWVHQVYSFSSKKKFKKTQKKPNSIFFILYASPIRF